MTGTVKWRGVRVDKLTPPGVADERNRAIVEAVASLIRERPMESFVFRGDFETVDAKMLPALVAENSLEEFIESGLPERVIRRLLTRAFELHSLKGYVIGSKLGLELLGMHVNWVQWWQEQPMAESPTEN